MNQRRDVIPAIAVAIGFVLMQFVGGTWATLGALLVILTLGAVVANHVISPAQEKEVDYVSDPPFARALFSSTHYTVLWLALRLFIGFQWVDAGLHKLGDPAWMQSGEALMGFWTRAVSIPETGRPAITYDWYRNFLQGMLDSGAYTWFAKLVALGEFLVGVALIIGLFVGIAAFFGAFMNFNFMLAGSASVNPVLFFCALLLVLAWKVAGHYGLDRFALSILGTPWSPGKLFTQTQ